MSNACRAASTALDMSAACASATLKKNSSVPESITLIVASGLHPLPADEEAIGVTGEGSPTRWRLSGEAVPAPHAMTLATADDQGRPSSRVLICKDVDVGGRWYFASGAASGKGRDLAVNPHAAVSFFWPQQGRQIRLRGTTVPAGRLASAADFLARPPASRAEALIGRQSEPLGDLAELDQAYGQALARVTADPGLIAPAWTLYALTADEAEFWQGDLQRRHVRLRYQRAGDIWTRQLLCP